MDKSLKDLLKKNSSLEEMSNGKVKQEFRSNV